MTKRKKPRPGADRVFSISFTVQKENTIVEGEVTVTTTDPDIIYALDNGAANDLKGLVKTISHATDETPDSLSYNFTNIQ